MSTTLLPEALIIRARDARDGDILFDDAYGSLTVGKVETLCVQGVERMYRVCDRHDSRIGWWYDRYDKVTVLRGPHEHTTHRCL